MGGSLSIPDVPPSYLLHDTFTDTDGIALSAHTMDVGSGWIAHYGTPQVQGNKAKGTVFTDNAATADAGTANVTMSADWTYDDGDDYAEFFVRYVDNFNVWFVGYNRPMGRWEIAERVAGADTLRASSTISLSSGTYTVAVTCSGTTIILSVDSIEKCRYESASAHQSATRFGIYVSKPGGTVPVTAVDNFEVTT